MLNEDKYVLIGLYFITKLFFISDWKLIYGIS